MVLLKPKAKNSVDTGCVTRLTVRCMGPKEKATFNYQTVISNLMKICFPTKIVTRDTADKPWVTDWFRYLVRKRQRAHISGDLNQAKILLTGINSFCSS